MFENKKLTIPIVASLSPPLPEGIPSQEQVEAFIDREFVRKPLRIIKERCIVGYVGGSTEILHPEQEKEIRSKLLWFLGLEHWQARLEIKLKETYRDSIDISLLIDESGRFDE